MPGALHVGTGTSRRVADASWPVLFRIAMSESLEVEVRVPPGCDRIAQLDRLRLVRELLSEAIRNLEGPCQPA